MLLGIISDTHDRLPRTRVAVQTLRAAGAEALVHCGDFCGAPILHALAALPCWFVFGNNDSDAVPELRAAAAATGATCLEWGGTFELAGRRIGVTHGHMTDDVRRVLALEPEFLLSGHSHLHGEKALGTVRRINPGALHRARRFTVATLDLATGAVQWLTVPE